MQYDNTDKGALFKNNRKETERHPDYTGKIDVGGSERYISAWLKESKNGNKFLSLSLGKSVDGAANNGSNGSYQKPVENNNFHNDDIPF